MARSQLSNRQIYYIDSIDWIQCVRYTNETIEYKHQYHYGKITLGESFETGNQVRKTQL